MGTHMKWTGGGLGELPFCGFCCRLVGVTLGLSTIGRLGWINGHR